MSTRAIVRSLKLRPPGTKARTPAWQALYDDPRPHEVLERVGDSWRLWGRFASRSAAVSELMRLARVRGCDAVRLRRCEPAPPIEADTPSRRTSA